MELVTTDEPPVVAKPLLNAIVVEDSQRDRRFANPTYTNEGDRTEAFGKADNVFDEVLASEAIPRWWGRGFSEHTRFDISYRIPLKPRSLTWLGSRQP